MPAGLHNKTPGDVPPGPGSSKRKRDLDDNGIPSLTRPDRIPQPRPPQSGNTAPINYLFASGTKTSSLSLLRGDNSVFNEVISLINDYEGVLGRNESLAANLGAKLTAPRLLGAMESLFEGEIKVYPKNPSGADQPYKPSWLDILEFAASNPDDFNLTTLNGVGQVCRFSMKNVDVQISWDDWRLIRSGALDRFSLVPPKPLEEDERIELTTLDIIEDRVYSIIQKADEIARKARQLNYHLSGRKAAITARYTLQHASELDQPPARHRELKPDPDLRAHVLQQFLSQASRQAYEQAAIPNTGKSSLSPPLALPSSHSQSHLPRVATTRSLPTAVPLQPLPLVGTSQSLNLKASDVQMPTPPGTFSDPLQQRTGSSRTESTAPQDPPWRLFEETSSALECLADTSSG
ncbi:hypothetical protein SMACR_05381 [Sordaria macrospora]|uniref:Uncharacterized protein n=1 Tax=Sordaria macrospora TaxID=5147 RepID=A0A8S8ZJM0_SORMA|nr:hypothetical protein SMACR_05381 [Sordaria macrospora]WPJ57631.1 hypothetical protein SMAC4_05381 [Sordaria macrospora]